MLCHTTKFPKSRASQLSIGLSEFEFQTVKILIPLRCDQFKAGWKEFRVLQGKTSNALKISGWASYINS
jgi:hypothetical protein